MTTYRTRDGIEYPRYEKFTDKRATCGLTWIPLLVGENRVRYYEASQLTEVKSPFDSGMVYDQPAIPQNFDSGLLYTVEPDPRTMDNVLALTEILNTRNPERQASRDLYTYQLYCEIADTIAA